MKFIQKNKKCKVGVVTDFNFPYLETKDKLIFEKFINKLVKQGFKMKFTQKIKKCKV